MKKMLLLQTALVAAAGMMLADVANAQSKAQPLAVTVGGYFTQYFGMQDRDSTQTDQHSSKFASDAEIHFNIRGVLDNGTVIGGRVELEAASYGDQIDERYMFLEHRDTGRIEMGSTDRASSKMAYFAPTVIPGMGTKHQGEYTYSATSASMRFANNGDDNEGINIYTASNRYLGSKAGKGLQLGFSYVPDGCQDFGTGSAGSSFSGASGCGGGFGSTVNTGQLSKQYAVAANYLETFGAVDVALYGGWNSVRREGTAQGRVDGWQLGSLLAYKLSDGGAIQLGGGYSNEDVQEAVGGAGGQEREVYSVGLRYLSDGSRPGSVGIGVEYLNREDEVPTTGAVTEHDYYQLGVTYQLAAGVLTFAGAGVSDLEAPAGGTDIKQTFGLVGIGLSF